MPSKYLMTNCLLNRKKKNFEVLPVKEWRRDAAKHGPGETEALRPPSDMERDEPKLSEEWS
jgi:hypothetical protein